MKKITLVAIYICYSILTFSQVGINTENPTEILDVNGSVQIRSDINVSSANDKESTSYGGVGDFLVSQGADKPPIWKNMPNLYWGITQTIVLTGDESGVIFGPYGSGLSTVDMVDNNGTMVNSSNIFPPATYTITPIEENSLLDSSWKPFNRLEGQVYVERPDSKLAYSFQAMLQTTAIGAYFVGELAIGVFVDNQLKSVRSVQLINNARGFTPISLMDIIEGLQPKADKSPYNVRVAARMRYFHLEKFGSYSIDNAYRYVLVGTADETSPTSTNTTNFMNQSSFTLYLYESTKTN